MKLKDILSEDEERTKQACEWFARCDRAATGTTPHPVLGKVPTCDRCHKFVTGKSRKASENEERTKLKGAGSNAKRVPAPGDDWYYRTLTDRTIVDFSAPPRGSKLAYQLYLPSGEVDGEIYRTPDGKHYYHNVGADVDKAVQRMWYYISPYYMKDLFDEAKGKVRQLTRWRDEADEEADVGKSAEDRGHDEDTCPDCGYKTCPPGCPSRLPVREAHYRDPKYKGKLWKPQKRTDYEYDSSAGFSKEPAGILAGQKEDRLSRRHLTSKYPLTKGPRAGKMSKQSIRDLKSQIRGTEEDQEESKSKRRQLTDQEATQVGLWMDDPYGDGIRLDIIREPSKERQAAIEFVQSGQPDMFDLHQGYVNRGRQYAKTRSGWNQIIRQGVLKAYR